MRTVLALAVAVVLALLAERYKFPGGALVGAMVGAATISLSMGAHQAAFPKPVVTAALILLGCSIGLDVNAGTLTALRGLLIPAVLSGVLLIGAGILIAFVLQKTSFAPPDAVLATSPGGLSALAGIASSTNNAAAAVVLFHVVRLVMVIVSLPVISRLL